MSEPRGAMGSSYMNWAKTRSQARINLATSGMPNLPLKELRVSLEDLEITDGGYGYEPLKRLIAARYGVETESIVTAAGTSFANHLAIAALINPGDEVLFETPAYEPMLATAQFLGAKLKRFPRVFDEGFEVLPEAIEQGLTRDTRLIVLTNLHNPTGVLTSDETLKAVGALARDHGARVLVDEVYIETLFERRPRTAFHLGPEFVITSSLTKAFGLSGLRCGWIFAEPKLARRMWLLNDVFASTPVHSGERLSVLALEQIEGIASRAKQLLDHNRQLLNEFLDSRDDLEVVRPQFGTTMFPRLKGGNVDELWDLLRTKYETSVVPGRFFELPNHFRIGFAVETETLIVGLKRLGQALDEG
ncbi:MAG TPA: pyridoxal phosphate-dependent aminotransferase [Pyrinomonadaceae bacterium]|nr:pyridoxal phosphate-dependent aminotransferase [Pyrinomonadaceae bacterium]